MEEAEDVDEVVVDRRVVEVAEEVERLESSRIVYQRMLRLGIHLSIPEKKTNSVYLHATSLYMFLFC